MQGKNATYVFSKAKGTESSFMGGVSQKAKGTESSFMGGVSQKAKGTESSFMERLRVQSPVSWEG